MPIDRSSVRALVRAIAYDVKGARLGRVAQVFLDDRSDEPAWVAVDVTRVRGMRLLPLAGAAMKGRHLVIRAERAAVRSAPRIDLGDGQLSSQDESRLLEHFGLTPAGRNDRPGTAEQRPASPWPDDTERETAWERPAPWQQDTQALPAAGWPAPPSVIPPVKSADAPTEQVWGQSTVDSSGIGDRETMRSREAGPGEPEGPAPVRQRDTEPSVIIVPPTTPSQADQTNTPSAEADSSARPDSRTQPSTAAIPVQPGPSAQPAQPAQPANVPETRPDADGPAR
ncbi:MAG: hypothetical protein H0T54_04860 [Geodermatophilaceae bacterium]|nr:hypothetical protein [Geodermatophilaceae bacterium]